MSASISLIGMEDVIVNNIEGLEDDDRLRLQIIRQVALSIFWGF